MVLFDICRKFENSVVIHLLSDLQYWQFWIVPKATVVPAGSLTWLQAGLTLRSHDLADVMMVEVSMVGKRKK